MQKISFGISFVEIFLMSFLIWVISEFGTILFEMPRMFNLFENDFVK